MTDVYISIPVTQVPEQSYFNATAYFRSEGTGATPANVKYRVDCLTTGKEIIDWTSLTPAESVQIALTSVENAIQDQGNKTERKQLVVESGADFVNSQTVDKVTWKVENIHNFLPR